MTPGGEMMLRLKAKLVPPLRPEVWREKRAKSLARMIARRQVTPRGPGRDHVGRIIREDIIPDIGRFPRLGWLKRRVRREVAIIIDHRREWGAPG